MNALWANKLARRLDKPQNWKEVNDVVYTDAGVYNFPLLSASNEGAVATLTNTQAGRSLLSNVVPFTVNTQTNQTLSISIAEIISDYKDYADQAQSNYSNMAEMGTYLGKKMGERLEAISLANHAAWTNFGDTGGGVLGLASTAITSSATNIDDIVRGIIEQIQAANGWDLYMENGGFVEWRAKDWTFLVQYMQNMGYSFADEALKDGGASRLGKQAMGLYHYQSNAHASDHVFAGVRKCQKLGILSKTFGKVYKAEIPASSTAGSLSGTQIHTRADYGLLVPTNLLPVTFDVNMNA
jgi:hypothetical protein